MSTTEHEMSPETGTHEFSESTDRPEGNVDEDANPPLTDPTETAVDRSQELIPRRESARLCRPTRDASKAPQKRAPRAAARTNSKPRIKGSLRSSHPPSSGYHNGSEVIVECWLLVEAVGGCLWRREGEQVVVDRCAPRGVGVE